MDFKQNKESFSKNNMWHFLKIKFDVPQNRTSKYINKKLTYVYGKTHKTIKLKDFSIFP